MPRSDGGIAMMRALRGGLLALLAASGASAQVSFFIGGNVSGADGPFLAALSAPATTFTFDSYSNFQEIDRIAPAIDLSLVGPGGEFRSSKARVFFSSAFNAPGRVHAGALLGSTSTAWGQFRLDFDAPVEAVGGWLYDDGSGIRNHARLTVIDTLGNSFTSDIVDANPSTAHGIDGFVGAVSCAGIVAAIFESYDSAPLAWNSSHELDNVRVGRTVAAALPNLSRPCPGSDLTLTAAAPGATTFQWRRNGVDLPGENGPTLTLAGVTGADDAIYDCVVDTGAGACGTTATAPARVIVCRADLSCDAAVDDTDFVLFVAAYNLLVCDDPAMPGSCPADLNGDALVDDADFVLFASAYNALLCP